ncbi:MAG TPA: dihydrofolate reductase [Bauldia sp.]|nr:dihydrofolate reductase [Bauldia sp.]
MTVRIALIAAVASNGVIGAGGAMPWRLTTDMQRFRRLTIGKPVVMGRKTFASIGRPLSGRANIVVTRHGLGPLADIIVQPSLERALAAAAMHAALLGATEIMVIGGGEIYSETIGKADRLYITHVDAHPPGDTYFPPIDPVIWQPASSERIGAGPADTNATTFTIYERRTSPDAA